MIFHGVLYSIIQAVQDFMAFFRKTFVDATITIKMHTLEDHATQWANATHSVYSVNRVLSRFIQNLIDKAWHLHP